ncbi:putative mitochondrial protein [Andalucia godoyi]|uniref:Putative mitochondrial protein n=1 Tax=Andalucia godoyi TaxID=505711 RepID=A0A8K0AGD3_ANDGO|nr:putative mitochondrial protein [Andalucia godoyi]|eukprot:ANDGO_05935.mRNA.1 putative mitochondrial protein
MMVMAMVMTTTRRSELRLLVREVNQWKRQSERPALRWLVRIPSCLSTVQTVRLLQKIRTDENCDERKVAKRVLQSAVDNAPEPFLLKRKDDLANRKHAEVRMSFRDQGRKMFVAHFQSLLQSICRSLF